MQARRLHIDVDQLRVRFVQTGARPCFAGKMLTQINGPVQAA